MSSDSNNPESEAYIALKKENELLQKQNEENLGTIDA